jgi:hypothetical protein
VWRTHSFASVNAPRRSVLPPPPQLRSCKVGRTHGVWCYLIGGFGHTFARIIRWVHVSGSAERAPTGMAGTLRTPLICWNGSAAAASSTQRSRFPSPPAPLAAPPSPAPPFAGNAFLRALQVLDDRLGCPRCGSRYVRVLFDPPLNQAVRRERTRSPLRPVDLAFTP